LATGENEKRLLAAMVRDRLIGDRNIVLYKELLEQKIPTFLKNYLRNSVQKFIYTEEPIQFNNSKRFDFEYSKIQESKQQLIAAFEEATIFSRAELVEIINRTVSLQFNLLVKPGATLLKIFYKNKSDRVQRDLLKTLEGLEDQRIFIKTLIKNIKEFDQFHIVEEDFKKILKQTQQEVYQGNFIASFVADVKAFADFLSVIQGQENQKIDIKFTKLLLAERNLEQYIPAFDIYPDTKIAIDKIEWILKNYLNHNDGDEASDMDVDDIENFVLTPLADNRSGNFQCPDSKLYENAINQSFAPAEPGGDNPVLSRSIEKPYKKKAPKIINIGKDPYDMIITRSKIEAQPDVPLDSLTKLIDEKDRKFIQKRIFDNDSHAYNEFIRQLELVRSWKEAKRMIDNELFMRSIEPFSKEALRLGDVVFSRYFPKRH